MKRRRVQVLGVLGIFLVAAGVAAAVALTVSAFQKGEDSPLGSWDAQPLSTPYTIWAAEPDKTAVWNHRPLGDDEIAEAVRIATGNADVLAAMGGDVDNGKVESVERVMRGNERVGALVYFTLTKPVDLDRVMPELEFITDADAAEDVAKGYKETRLHYKATGLTKFRAHVDFRAGRVVGFQVEEAETNVQSFADAVPAD